MTEYITASAVSLVVFFIRTAKYERSLDLNETTLTQVKCRVAESIRSDGILVVIILRSWKLLLTFWDIFFDFNVERVQFGERSVAFDEVKTRRAADESVL